jgi:hypothetical protein
MWFREHLSLPAGPRIHSRVCLPVRTPLLRSGCPHDDVSTCLGGGGTQLIALLSDHEDCREIRIREDRLALLPRFGAGLGVTIQLSAA